MGSSRVPQAMNGIRLIIMSKVVFTVGLSNDVHPFLILLSYVGIFGSRLRTACLL